MNISYEFVEVENKDVTRFFTALRIEGCQIFSKTGKVDWDGRRELERDGAAVIFTSYNEMIAMSEKMVYDFIRENPVLVIKGLPERLKIWRDAQ